MTRHAAAVVVVADWVRAVLSAARSISANPTPIPFTCRGFGYNTEQRSHDEEAHGDEEGSGEGDRRRDVVCPAGGGWSKGSGLPPALRDPPVEQGGGDQAEHGAVPGDAGLPGVEVHLQVGGPDGTGVQGVQPVQLEATGGRLMQVQVQVQGLHLARKEECSSEEKVEGRHAAQ